MPINRNIVDRVSLNSRASLPYELRIRDFESAMQDAYDFFYDVNASLVSKGLQRLDDMLRPAIMSGVLSDMLTASLARHSRVLTENTYFNGHPDLIVQGVYPENAVKAGSQGIEVKRRGRREERLIPTARESNGCASSFTASTMKRSRPRTGNP